jgi:hypothetical protein
MFRQNSTAASGILSIDNDKINGMFFFNIAQLLGHDFSARAAYDVTDA